MHVRILVGMFERIVRVEESRNWRGRGNANLG